MPFRNMSLQKKLMAIMLMTSGVVLALTCAAFCVYEILTFRHTTVQQLTTVARIIAANSTAVLAFDDQGGAREILAALKAEPNIVAAGLYGQDGKLFASYPESLAPERFPAAPGPEGFRFEKAYLAGFQPVSQGQRRLGALYVRSDLRGLSDRIRLYLIVTGVVAGLAFMTAYLLTRTLQRQISRPILALAETARAVSDRRDYSVRAHRQGSEELDRLTDAFNHMLNHIQEQLTRLELLNRITRAIGERQDLPSIFQVMVRTLEDSFAVDFGCVCLYETLPERLLVMSVGVKGEAIALEKGMPLPIDRNGLSECVQGRLVYEADISSLDFPFPRRLAQGGLNSVVLSPLLVEGKVFGVLIVGRKAAHGFSSLDCEFIHQLSEHSALAANQADLHAALQQAYDDLKQSQQTVMQQERLRALGQMASGIAHDINNAISPVSLYTESLLDNEPGLSPRARNYLQTISNAIEDVAATVSRMREFYRQHESRMILAPVDLNRALQQVLDLTRARWHDVPNRSGHVIRIRMELDPALPAVAGVEGEIREAFTNLFLNAFDAMPEGGTLTLTTRVRRDGRVQAEVTDTGIGMDEETRRRCLEPFYTTKGERGTGLGLAMVYGVAQRHNADVELDSIPGQGATVRLVFPVPEFSKGEDAPIRIAPPAPLRLLVVDDDPLLLKSLNDTLTGEGHAVTIANGGQAGIDAFAASLGAGRPYDAVISDLGMPFVDGRKVAAAIKEASAGTPVLLLTGWGQRLLSEGDIPPHVDQLLSKPPKIGRLREALAKHFPPKAG